MPIRPKVVVILGCLALLIVAPSCGSSKQDSAAPGDEVAEVSIPRSVEDCLASMRLVVDSLQTGDTTVAQTTQSTCRSAMVDLDTDESATQPGTRAFVEILFISDMNTAVASVITTAGGRAPSADDLDRLDKKLNSLSASIRRVLDPNQPFAEMPIK